MVLFGYHCPMKSFQVNNHINDNGSSKRIVDDSLSNDIEAEAVDRIADYLVSRLESPESREFFCWVAWNLPEHIIEERLMTALLKGRVPGAYFNTLVRKEIEKLDIMRAPGSKRTWEEEHDA